GGRAERLAEEQFSRYNQQERPERLSQGGVRQPTGQMRARERPEEEPDGDDDGIGDVDLPPPVILDRAEQADRKEQGGKRRSVRRVLRQLQEQHQRRHDHDRSPDAEQPRHHARHQADQRHQHPGHRSSPCCGWACPSPSSPHPPPPGVSMRSASPGTSDTLTLDPSATPFNIVAPGAPSRPPAAPRGPRRRRSARIPASIGASASNSRTTPSPPLHCPTPPPLRPKPSHLSPKG